MAIDYYLYYLYYTLLGYPFIIRVAITYIGIFVPFYCLTSCRISYERKEYYLKKKLQKRFKTKYAENIKHILTSKVNYSYAEIQGMLNCHVKKLTSKKKRVLTNRILAIKDREEYINKGNIQQLVGYFELQKFWEGKLKYGSLASRQKALRKLDDFDIEIPGSMITSLTYNRNQHLRKRARSYYMNFSKNDPYKFLEENFDQTFNTWDKIEIHRVLSRRVEEGLPSLTQYIENSRNVEFRCFLVDEIKHFNQKESCPYLLELVNGSHDVRLRKHCIDALGEMGYVKAEPLLMKDYALQSRIIQNSVVIALQKLNTGEALGFLEDAYYNAHDTESKLIILRAIFNYGTSGRNLFDSMKIAVKGFSQQIFDHVSNPLIKFN